MKKTIIAVIGLILITSSVGISKNLNGQSKNGDGQVVPSIK